MSSRWGDSSRDRAQLDAWITRQPDERYGTDQDPSITVGVTGDGVDHCFMLTFGSVVVNVHARSLADLIHKATLALLDWQAQLTLELLAELGGDQ